MKSFQQIKESIEEHNKQVIVDYIKDNITNYNNSDDLKEIRKALNYLIKVDSFKDRQLSELTSEQIYQKQVNKLLELQGEGSSITVEVLINADYQTKFRTTSKLFISDWVGFVNICLLIKQQEYNVVSVNTSNVYMDLLSLVEEQGIANVNAESLNKVLSDDFNKVYLGDERGLVFSNFNSIHVLKVAQDKYKIKGLIKYNNLLWSKQSLIETIKNNKLYVETYTNSEVSK